MQLYSRTGATSVNDMTYGTFEPDAEGAFNFPEPLGALLVTVHHKGVKLWETSIEKQRRLIAEEDARRRDPAALLDAVLALQQQAAANAVAKAAETEQPKTTRRSRKGAAAETGDDTAETGSEPDDAGDGDPNT